MPDIVFNLDADGKRLYTALQKSEKKVDQLEAKLSRSGKSASTGFGKAAVSAKEMGLAIAGSMLGVSSLQGVIQGVVGQVRKGIEEIRAMERGAAEQQRTRRMSVGQFLANNPQLGDDQAKSMVKFAEAQGGKLGGENAAERVLAALTKVRSGTPGADAGMQQAAIESAIQQAIVDPNTDIGQYATAIVKLQQKLGGSTTQGANVLGMYGARAGGDIAGLSGNIGKLAGVQGVAKSEMNDIVALHAFLTGETGDTTGEESSTTTRNLLSRITTRDLKIGGKKVGFQAEGGVDRLRELSERIRKGEFGDQGKATAEAAKQLMRGASGVTALGSLVATPERFEETRKMVGDARTTDRNFAAENIERAKRLQGGFEGIRTTEQSTAARDSAEAGDLQGAAWANVDTRLESFDETYGLRAAGDPMRWTGHRWLTRKTPLEYETAERARRLRLTLSRRGALDTSTGASPFEGVTDTEAMLRQSINYPVVRSEGGVDRLERNVLEAAGATRDDTERLQKLWLDGQKEAFKESLNELITELRRTQTNPTAQEVD